MGKIDINTTSKVNIEAQKNNTFELVMDVKNEDGTIYDFTDDLLLFAIYDDDDTPLKIASHNFDANNHLGLPHNNNEIIPGLPQTVNPFFNTSNSSDGFVSNESLRFARVLSNLYNCDINIFEFKGSLVELVFVFSQPTLLQTSVTDSSSLFLNPVITILNGIVTIKIPALFFNLNQGTYKYNIKIVSDIKKIYDINLNEIDAKFQNSTTWMEGKFIIK